jgi:hypothetical protein
MKLPKSHFNGINCKGGKHKVDVGHGESVRMCGPCYREYMAGPKRTTTDIINDYQTVYRQLRGKNLKIVQRGGWLDLGPWGGKVRPSKLAQMTDNLRKRL